MDRTVSRRRLPALGTVWPAAVAGSLAAGASMAGAELIAGLVPGAPSLVTAMGDLVISLQPPGAKELAVTLFGLNDKLALNVAVVVAALAIAAVAGVLAARRRFAVGAGIFLTFGVLGAYAALRQPLTQPVPALATVVAAVAAGLVVLRKLLDLAGARRPASPDAAMPDWARRRFVIASAGTVGGLVAAGAVGRMLVNARHVEGVVSTSRLPAALAPAVPPSADQSLDVAGITPLVVSNEDFYRIDTALLVPQVDVASWRLAVTGLVDRPFELGYDELLALPLHEQYVTIACVSNRVGGQLVGNALWTGVRLRDILDIAGVQDGATQIVGRSVDDFTVGFPTAWAMAPEREALVAVGMNGLPLPADHGFPARLIVPGLYGYVSATKWLAELQLTTREAVDGYWIPLGWAKDAPILTQSRIDVPLIGAQLAAGTVPVAGVAWAPDRGIARVEVSIDDGAWQEARMSRPISNATWVQWAFDWSAAPGRHTIDVRATDGTGEVQTDRVTDPAPDGARGHHRIFVSVA